MKKWIFMALSLLLSTETYAQEMKEKTMHEIVKMKQNTVTFT